MRKIESAMLAAIHKGRNWSGGNTTVSILPSGWRVTLHGHLIAEQMGDLLQVSLAGWNTVTTRSRLTAIIRSMHSPMWPLGAGVCTRNGIPHLHDRTGARKIDATGWHVVSH